VSLKRHPARALRRTARTAALLSGLVVALTLPVPGSARAQGPVSTAELTDAAGDVNEFNGKGNSFDVVKVGLGSDGTHLLVSVTLAGDPGTMAGAAVELYIDADNNAKTGGRSEWGPAGFEHRAEVGVCLKTASGKTCSGGTREPVKLKHAATMVEKFTGAAGAEMERPGIEMTVDHLQSPEKPLEGRMLKDKVAYSALGVKKGQVLRIAVRESDNKESASAFLPDVLLKLN
jgi:hypothetical protein